MSAFFLHLYLMKRIGVMTSGGDAPGMNACIRAVVRSAAFHNVEVVGIRLGFQGMIENEMYLLNVNEVVNIIQYYDTAVNTALDAIDRIRDTADSHNRIFFIEVMGRDSGFIALNSGLAGGAEAILLPEVMNDYDDLIAHFDDSSKRRKAFSIIVVAEGETNGDAFQIAEKFQSRFPEFDIRVSVLGHIQRGGKPSANDRILASTLGNAAVEQLLAGKTNVCVGVVNQEVKITSYADAISNRKSISPVLWNLSKILSY